MAIRDSKIAVCDSFSSHETARFMARYPRLDEGESQVLIMGMRLKEEGMGYCCVLDEGPATKIAFERGIVKKGTIGILRFLNDLGVIDESRLERLLNRLKHSTFRIKDPHMRESE